MIKKFQILNFKIQIFLFAIVILAAVLRLWNISGNPPGLTWDEAAIGYNAYSLLQTGKDEYGQIFPLNFKSFGDYKPGIYIYADIPFVAIFGLNEVGVRLPNAIAGILMVVLLYLLIVELLGNRNIALFCALMVAVSPLGIQFSRPAFESNLDVALNLAGMLMFIKGLSKPKLFLFSGFLFGLSLFTYQGSRIFLPLLLIGLYLVFQKNISFKKEMKFGLLIFGAIIFLMAYLIFVGKQSGRLEAMNFFAYRRSNEVLTRISKEDGLLMNGLQFRIIHGDWFAYLKGLTERYLIYFSPRMLFIDGDYSPRHRVPDLGVLYFISVFLLPLGLFYLFKRWDSGSRLILFLLLIGSIPAVLSRDLISMVRALNLLIPFSAIEGIGLYFLFISFKKLGKPLFILSLLISAAVLISNFGIFLDRYFIHAPIKYSQGWLYGYREVLDYVNKNLDLSKYDNIVMTDDYGQPYIYYLFYTKYPPQNYQTQAFLDQSGVDVGTIRKIDNIYFRHVYWPKDRGLSKSLFIATKEELPDKDILPFAQYKILKDINFLDGTHAFRVVESF